MYQEFWGLNEAPFEETADHRFFFNSRSHEDALMVLHYGIVRNKGGVVLVGAPGSGKSLLTQRLASFFDLVKANIIRLDRNPNSSEELIGALHLGMKLSAPSGEMDTLRNELMKQVRDGRNPVLILDNAQQIQDAKVWNTLEQISSWERDSKWLLPIIFLGSPFFSIPEDSAPSLSERISARFELRPIEEFEVGELIDHRIQTAGRCHLRSAFTVDAKQKIFQVTHGNPREIVRLADRAMQDAFLHRSRFIDGLAIHELVATDFKEGDIRIAA